jgi:integrase
LKSAGYVWLVYLAGLAPVVSRFLGHTTIATTADIYGHLTPTWLDRAAERMDAILSG